jgi:outer membrane protein TolC
MKITSNLAQVIIFNLLIIINVEIVLADKAKAKTLTIAEVAESAEKFYPKIIEAYEEINAANANLLSARGNFDPLISLDSRAYGSGYYDGSNSTSSRLTVPLEFSSTDLFMGGRSGHGNFPVYEDQYDTLNIGEIGAGLRIALLRNRAVDKRRTALMQGEISIDQEKQQLESEKLIVLEEAAKSYWIWNINKEQLHVFEELLRVSELRQSQFEQQVTAGQMARIEALDNSRTILTRREKLLQQQQKLNQASQKLSLYHRDNQGLPIVTTDISTTILPKIYENTYENIEKLSEKAYERHPDIISFNQEIELLKREKDLNENNLLPKLDLETAVTRDYGDGETSREGSELKGMLFFEVPLYRREAKGKIKALEAKINAVKQKIRLTKDRIRAFSRANEEIIRKTHNRYQILKTEVELAQQLEEAEWEKFKAGQSNLLIVAIREIATATVRIQKLETILENRLAHIELASLVGDKENIIIN